MDKKMYKLLDEHGNEYLSEEKGIFGGHKGNRINGRMDCSVALRYIAMGYYVKQRVFFKDEITAIKAGFRPCSACMPDEYKEWKRDSKAFIKIKTLGHK